MNGFDTVKALLRMQLKPGVDIELLDPIMERAITAAARVAVRLDAPSAITAGLDGDHMEGSLHYKGLAIDVRRADWPSFTNYSLAETQRDLIRRYLDSEDFDVIIEGTHIHIEYDPKPRA